eukprot:COSAG01_NODE_75535_length_195_cov_25.968750_1_plen_50_part_10
MRPLGMSTHLEKPPRIFFRTVDCLRFTYVSDIESKHLWRGAGADLSPAAA